MTDELTHDWQAQPRRRLRGRLTLKLGERVKPAEPNNDHGDDRKPAA